VSEDTETPSQESPDSEAPPVEPLEVKIISKPTKPELYDSQDDIEYEEIIVTDEDKDI